MTDVPAVYEWDGEVMVPLPRFLPLCSRQYVAGERYRLVVHEDRSSASHNHYFARIHEVWLNLPEDVALFFPDDDTLRKWALCRTEYRTVEKFIWPTRETAVRVAYAMRPTYDEYAEISVHDCVVVRVKPKSQSLKAMGKKAFQDSKDKVLDVLAAEINISPETLAANAGRAA